MFNPLRGHWRTVYALQVVHAQLLPPDDEDVTRAIAWRRQFLASGGFEHFVRFVMELQTESAAANSVVADADAAVRQRDTFTLPACLRSLSFLLAGAMQSSFGAAGSDETAVPRAPLRRQASEGNGVGGTSIPKLARQFSSDSETRIVDGLQPAPLVAKVAALLRAAHAVHAPLHTSPLLRGPQPGDAVLAEYMEAGGKL